MAAAPKPNPAKNVSMEMDWLPRMCRLTGAAGAGLWNVMAKSAQCERQFGLGDQSLEVVHLNWQGHAELLRRVAEFGTHEVAQAAFDELGQQRTLKLLVLRLDNARVLELFYAQSLPLPPDVISELVTSLICPSPEVQIPDSTLETALQILGRRRAEEMVAGLINDLRVWSGADRVSLVKLAAHPQILAISGLPTFDPRSAVVRELSLLVQQLRSQLAESGMCMESHRWLWSAPQTGHVLVFEGLSESALVAPSEASLTRMQAVAQQCLIQSDLLLKGQRNSLQQWLEPLWSSASLFWGTAAFMTFGIVLALSTIQADLILYLPGHLEPQTSRMLFTPVSAVVETVHVTAGQKVSINDPLLDLRSDALDLEAQRLTGEVRTVEQQLADLETLRSDPTRDRTSATNRNVADLTMRSEELDILKTSLAAQLEVVQRQRATLNLKSPLDGAVLTWEVDQLLQGRPVTTDQILLRIADLDGPWELEFLVPQEDLAAFTRQPVEDVSFALAGGDQRHLAKVGEHSPELRLDSDHGLVLPVSAKLSSPAGVQPGTQVIVRVNCGQAPVGYVWFRHVIDQLVRWSVLRG